MSRPLQRVLIVDDHVMIRRGLFALMNLRYGFRVVGEAADGIEALNLAGKLRPDIAIVDYSIPGLNGRDLTLELIKQLPAIEVLIYTHHDDPSCIFGALLAGARAYVLKSEGEADLLAGLEALSAHRPYFSGPVVDELLREVLRLRAKGGVAKLTTLEREMLMLVTRGRNCDEISEALRVSRKRAGNLRRALKEKIGEQSTAGLVRYAVRNGLIEP